MNYERLYENAKEALRLACISAHNGNVEDGTGLYNMLTKAPEEYLRSSLRNNWKDALPALEIYVMAKDELGKSKGGTTYNAVKRFLKGVPDARENLNGVWTDGEGRQCMCDSYHAIRLKNHVEGFKEARGMDLDKIFPSAGWEYNYNVELPLPTPGEVKINKKKLTSSRYGYDFGDGMPMVDADYLKNIMDCLPNAKAYTREGMELTGIIYFKDNEKGDAVLCPVRKRSA